MALQHIENLLIRYRGQRISIKSLSGAIYEGAIGDVTNDYVALRAENASGEDDLVIVLLHGIESILPQARR